MENILSIQHLSVSYEGKPALTDVNLEIPEHRITAILGPSGCGKSTLLRAINHLISEEPGVSLTGRVALRGQDVSDIPPEALRKKIGLVFQVPTPFPFSILKNMTYAPKYYGMGNRKALEALAVEKLKLAGLYAEVKDDLHKSALKLSGGQQQRLCIARALTVEPDVLLLDEPCSSLDVKATAVINKMLLELKERYTIVIVTHNIAQARQISDYAAVFTGEKLVETGPSAEIFQNPKEPETRAFLEASF